MHSTGTLIFVIIALFATVHSNDVDIAAMFPALMEIERIFMQEPCEDNSGQEEFDFIVVGAGPAGCVVANRLTEEEDWDVLLLEAGGEETGIMSIPSLAPTFANSDAAWNIETVPSESKFRGFINQQSAYTVGKVMGGSSTINGMLTIRGTKYDYDNIEQLGNPGWKYDDVLPYFKKVENIEIPELRNSEYHSTEGNIRVDYSPYEGELTSSILEAASEMGYPEVDYDGANSTGFSLGLLTMSNGSRWSASRGYLHPIRDRKNLYVRKRALVRRVLIDEVTKTAYGVEYTKEGKNYTVRARKEVILSAGAIHSPQILMLSGVGPREHLEEFGINVIQDSKVGYNAIEQGSHYGLLFTVNQSSLLTNEEIISNPQHYYDYFTSRKGPLTNAWDLSVISLFEIGSPPSKANGWTNLEALWYSPAVLSDENIAQAFGMTREVSTEFLAPLRNKSFYQVVTYPTRPKSRGRVSLQSGNIEIRPAIDPNLFSEEEDVELAVAGIKTIIELSETEALQKIGSKLYDTPIPPCRDLEFGSDEYWRCAVLQFSVPFWHISGTCKMGPSTDETAVVDPELKVYGIKGLRVIDTSIYPEMPSPHTMMPTYMAAEKGADFIKKDYLT